jgi:hypothetical protein
MDRDMNSRCVRTRGPAVFATGALVLLSGCGDAEQPGCPEGAEVVEVESSGDLAGAVDEASSGTCLALAAGSYPAVDLPSGVSLVGDSRASVTLAGAKLGPSSLLANVTVAGGTVVVSAGASGARIEGVTVAGSPSDGVVIEASGAATLTNVVVDAAAGYGIKAFDAAGLSLSDTTIEGTAGPGIWLQCGQGCDCPAPPAMSLARVSVREASRVGASFVGVHATLEGLTISDVRPGAASDIGLPIALSASACAFLDGHSVHVADEDPFDSAHGILLDGAGAKLGLDASRGIEVTGSVGGIWLQNVTEALPVELAHGRLTGNRGVGVGLGGSSVGIIIEWFEVLDTASDSVPVKKGDATSVEEVGDGLVWLGGAQAEIDNLVVGNSSRASVLIDGAVAPGSSLAHVTLQGADADKGILQQSYSGMGAPDMGAETPTIEQVATEQYSVPLAPIAPEAQ